MKKKSYRARIRRYLGRKSFSFDFRFFQCFYLVLSVFLSALVLSVLFYKLDEKFKLNDNPGSLPKGTNTAPIYKELE